MHFPAIITSSFHRRLKKMTYIFKHKYFSFIAGIAALLVLSSCGERLSSHGHLIDEYDLQNIVMGETTKNDILFSLGKPSFEGAFDSSKLYYVSQNMVQPAGGRKETTSREIFAFIFDENRWYQIKLRVTDQKFMVWIDNELVINCDLEGRKIGMRSGEIEMSKPLGITTYATTGEFKRIDLVRIQ